MTTVAVETRSARVVQRVRHVVPQVVRHQSVGADARVAEAIPRRRWMVVVAEDRGPSARVAALVLGEVVAAVAVAPTGSVAATRNVAILGLPADALVVAPQAAVSVNEELPGQTAEAFAVAPTGAVSAQRHTSVVGLVAEATAVALVGVVTAEGNVTVAGTVAITTADAPAGDVSVVRNVAPSGLPAAASASAPTGAVFAVRNIEVVGLPATATAAAPQGDVVFVVHAEIAGQTAAATATAPAGTVLPVRNIAVFGVTATSSVAAPAGSVATTRTVALSGLVAGATALAPTGVVQATRAVSQSGSTATASASAPTGSVAAVINLVRQRIAKNGTQSIGSGGQSVKITSWVSDGTYPGTVSSDGLYIPTAGSGVATASINIGGGFASGTCTLRKNATTASNGTQLGTVSIPTASGVRTITTGTISLAVGDILTVWYTISNDTGKTVTAASTFIDWNPSS